MKINGQKKKNGNTLRKRYKILNAIKTKQRERKKDQHKKCK
jgi:hypothetical protein